MLLLNSTSDLLQVVTDAAVTVDCHASYVDYDGTELVVAGRKNTLISTATTTSIALSPSTGVTRNVWTFTARNRHATTSVGIIVKHTDGTNVSEIWAGILLAGQSLIWTAGDVTVTGTGVRDLLFRALDADTGGQNIATVQPWFPASGAVTVDALTAYRLTGAFHSTRAAGTTSHTTGISFGGTATLTSIGWWAQCGEGEVATIADSDITLANTAANTNVKAASTSATEVIKLAVEGVVRINAGGTFIPQFTYSAAPGGVPTIKANTYFRLERLGVNTLTAIGTWA